ncbi:hypothetical protein CDAR_423951 [Caerostris darwini]|uniref:Uncharacterized protein n=1 Tax=Caerostris darwini TaxID=1538125 RepID=A0AAV4VFB4_9ARAC|nr:hypothetical protein CDAR_423951 [Caerostris darwini]
MEMIPNESRSDLPALPPKEDFRAFSFRPLTPPSTPLNPNTLRFSRFPGSRNCFPRCLLIPPPTVRFSFSRAQPFRNTRWWKGRHNVCHFERNKPSDVKDWERMRGREWIELIWCLPL